VPLSRPPATVAPFFADSGSKTRSTSVAVAQDRWPLGHMAALVGRQDASRELLLVPRYPPGLHSRNIGEGE
jgi:hypothetical protein